jgi:hypothetical protein
LGPTRLLSSRNEQDVFALVTFTSTKIAYGLLFVYLVPVNSIGTG